jgi:hypothetical protein
MEEKLDDYLAVRLEKSTTEKLRNLPRSERRSVAERIRSLVREAVRRQSQKSAT